MSKVISDIGEKGHSVYYLYPAFNSDLLNKLHFYAY